MIKPLSVILLASLIGGFAHADDQLGRLFLTPSERANLDYVRQSSPPPEKLSTYSTEPGETEGAPPPAPASAVTVQGYVKRTDGKGTVWINRLPVQEKSKVGEIEVGKIPPSGNRIRVKVPGANQPVTLKAGQTFDPASGTIVDYPSQLPAAREPPPPPVAQDKTAQPALTTEAPKKP